MASITVSTKVYMTYAVITKIVDGDIKPDTVKIEFPARNSRAAQKAIAEAYHVKAKDVNVIKIETVTKSVTFNGEFDALVETCKGAGFEKVEE